ncbi:tripartite tricarboxylate transporter TctB family protein [Nocardioides sp. JQ2195]|uniref:tripartite tricarboxylate transporter TctB family protein n=1 Tax=Nocardioides sp. JQ2195 TaxID=2592334 RepID=UPI00143E92B6|nr:tripartite tricarboxylate transporter TctB family protein [Nocardioides sp. JQ2195]QIX26161.1 tripartite tricarboxylate transporter TctB family protein [Nocardioides sp. JQ2195]
MSSHATTPGTSPGTSPATSPDASPTTSPARRQDRAQLGVAALLAAIGAYTLYDATTLTVGFADPVGPKMFLYVIGSVMLVLAALLVLATLRGDTPQAEAGEDVDLTVPADWVTVAKLVAVLLITVATVNWLGWAIVGAFLFAGAAWSLGSRTLIRDVIVGAVMSVGSWYGFYVGLGIPLTPGILDGIL